jgi:hypothetical protein
MSLELAINENTQAIRDMIAAIMANGVSAPVAKAKPAAKSEPTPAPVAPVAEATAGTPSYQDAAQAVTKLSRIKGRDAAVALLAQFGAGKLPEVKPEQFAEVITAANIAIGAA